MFRASKNSTARKLTPRALKIGGSIDAEGNGVNDSHVDAQPVLERAKLLTKVSQLIVEVGLQPLLELMQRFLEVGQRLFELLASVLELGFDIDIRHQ